MSSSLLLEAALRSVLLALAVWAGLRIFGVRNVLAQKAAWGLVLVSALGMPILLPYAAHWSVLPANVRVVIPDDPQTLLEELQARIKTAPQPKPLSEAVPAAEAASPTEGTSVDLAIDTADNGRAVQDTAIQDSAIQRFGRRREATGRPEVAVARPGIAARMVMCEQDSGAAVRRRNPART